MSHEVDSRALGLTLLTAFFLGCADYPEADSGPDSDGDAATTDGKDPGDPGDGTTGPGEGETGSTGDQPDDGENPRCGNGVLDDGEACDGEPCCASDCTIAAAGTQCRAAADGCDIAEVCDGVSLECAADARVATTVPVVQPEVSMGPGSTYPRATALADGRLFGVYERGTPTHFTLVSVVSEDEGQTWSELGVIGAEPTTPGRTFGNPHAVELPDGTLLAAFRHHDPVVNGRRNYRLLVSASSDGGQQWRFHGEIETFNGVEGAGIWEPFLFLTPQGRLQVYYAKERGPGQGQDIVLRESTDAGASWGSERVVATSGISRDGMPGVTTLQDGSLVAVFESFRQPGVNNRFVVRTVASNDDGQSWHYRQMVFAPSNTNLNAGAPQISTLADGRLVASFMLEDPNIGGSWPGNASTVIVVSENVPTFGNIVWSAEPIVVAPAASFWPGLAQAPLRDPLVTFAKGGVKASRVCLP